MQFVAGVSDYNCTKCVYPIGSLDCQMHTPECVGGISGYFVEDEKTTEEITASALDTQVGGDHYKGRFEIEPVEFIIKNKLEGAEASIVKYACRHQYKNGAEDIKKIIHYAQFILEFKYGEEV